MRIVEERSPGLSQESALFAHATRSGFEEAVRLIAFYLPQFHPIPENDLWWGPGFTEWTNVVRARPAYRGHYQPQLPADLGFYDLRLPESRYAQARLARQYGIHGFCYYHYWFQGKRLLEQPFEAVLHSGEPDFPFCLCWANEPWSRTWAGDEHSVLMAQQYSADDDRALIRSLLPAFRDRRYIRIDGKPLFLVYRVASLPHPARTADIWREEARKAGVGDLFLAKVESYAGQNYGDPAVLGFDAGVQFAPDSVCAGPQLSWSSWLREKRVDALSWTLFRALDKGGSRAAQWLAGAGLVDHGYVRHAMYRYDTLVSNMLARPRPTHRWYPCVTPSWDNLARRPVGAKIYKDATPEKYGAWLSEVVARQMQQPRDDRIVFVNAWNEWGEGNHLEPCVRWGHAYLEETRRAVLRSLAAPAERHE
jgi:lipopolysaccharide biosynthesis protein